MIYYSAETGYFYMSDINGSNIPADAKEISADLHAQLLDAQAQGKVISTGADGVPVAADPPAPTADEQAAIAKAQKEALMAVATATMAPLQDAVSLDIATDAEKTSLTAWQQYRVTLNRVDQQDGYPGTVEWPTPPA